MNNFEEKLNKIKVQKASESEKNSMWLGIITKREVYQEKGRMLLIFNFKKHMIGALIALVVILGGGGAVAASNSAMPGDTLFGLDLAVEKARINFIGDDSKKNELKVRFAEERLAEAKTIVESRRSINIADTDLSGATVTEIEVDVFTNETTVKIEANDRHYGFTTTEKEKSKIIDEIKAKYKLTDEQINSVLSFETEDRDSRADDKGFLNSEHSGFKSSKQQREFEGSLSEVADLIADSNLSDEEKAKLSATLAGLVTLLEANPGLEMEIKTKDGFKVEIENGKIEIKTNNGKSEDSKGEDHGNDVKEDDEEILCRGEWRDPEDCDDSSSDDDNDDGDDDSDDDDSNNDGENDSDDDNDNDEDESEDDDNSGHGNDDGDED